MKYAEMSKGQKQVSRIAKKAGFKDGMMSPNRDTIRVDFGTISTDEYGLTLHSDSLFITAIPDGFEVEHVVWKNNRRTTAEKSNHATAQKAVAHIAKLS